MFHPFQRIPVAGFRPVFVPFLVSTLVLMWLMARVGAPLETSAAPYGIISFELAGTPASAEKILASWDENARLHAAFSLGLDYLYMVVYSSTIALGCIWAAWVLRSRSWPLAGLGAVLAWGQWLAAILDGIENAGLTIILFSGSSEVWALLARWCALAKFALIFAGLTWVFFGLVIRLVVKPHK